MHPMNPTQLRQHAKVALLGLIALTAVTPAVKAQTVVYDNGSYSGATGAVGFSASAVADDFTLSSTTSFNAIRFWAFDIPSGLHPNFSGDVSWFLYSGSTGQASPNATPDNSSLFAQGTVTPTVTDTGDFHLFNPNFAIGQLDFSIPTQTLAAGTYWLRLKEGAANAASDGTPVYWMQSGSPQTGNGFRMDSNPISPTSWTSATGGTATSKDLAFQLVRNNNTVFSSANTAITPEAPGLIQLLAGLLPVAAFALLARRRRQKFVLPH